MTSIKIERGENPVVQVNRVDSTISINRGGPVVSVTRDGQPGPRGPGGNDTVTYVQPHSATEWLINHGLDRYPSVTIVDSAGTTVVGGVQYVDSSTLIVSFDYPFMGKAYLN